METKHLGYNDKVGILDPNGLELNPLNQKAYSDQYKEIAKVWSSLPGYEKAKDIIEAITDHQLIIAIMGTGTGKSVLVPKFALHYTNYQGKIGMTLPKKTITQATAIYSAQMSDVTLGDEIGYVYKGSERVFNQPTNRILYMTDGTLTVQILKDPELKEYNVIIIDEAHERKVQIDLILLYLRNLLQSGKRPDLKVILMSATINGAKYQNYFSNVDSVVIEVVGRQNYPVTVYFLEKPTTDYLQKIFQVLDTDILPSKKSALAFITTSREAFDMCRLVTDKYPKVYCIEVYADMDESQKILAQSSEKYLEQGDYDSKLVMATNVAESSWTIDGLYYVIDSGYELYAYFEPRTGAQVFKVRLIAKSQSIQRRGRVGRTSPGVCYHLLTEEQFNKLPDYATPDILTQDITIELLRIINQTKTKTVKEGLSILKQLMDVPKDSYINYATNLFNLYQITKSGTLNEDFANKILKFSTLPLNQSLFLIYAYDLHCVKEATIIVALLDLIKDKISNLYHKEPNCIGLTCNDKARKFVKKIASKKSDHLTLLKIFVDYKRAIDKVAWGKASSLKINMLKRADQIRRQLLNRILPQRPQSGGAKSDKTKNLLQALKDSHEHLSASHFKTTYDSEPVTGTVSSSSVIHFNYRRNDLENKKFIYNQLSENNGNYEFSIVTLF